MIRPAPHDEDRLAELLAALLDGTLSEADEKTLAQMLMRSPDLRRRYLDHLELHGLLRWSLLQQNAQPNVQSSKPPLPPTPTLRRSRSVWYISAAALIALAITIWFTTASTPHSAIRNPKTQPVALLSNIDNAAWGDSTVPTALGSELSPGTLSLQSGGAQVMFHSGAVVDMAGPCTLHMIGPNEAHLTRGRLEAYVPERARGFTVNAANLTVVDLGTRFFMLAHSPRMTTVGVRTGRVRLTFGDRRRELAAGDVLTITGDQNTPRTASAIDGLIHSARLRYDFDRPAGAPVTTAQITDASFNPHDPAHVVNPELMRFTEDGALAFSPRLATPGQTDVVENAGFITPGAARAGAQTMMTRFYWAGYACDDNNARMGWLINNGLTGQGGWLFGVRNDRLALHSTTGPGSFDSEPLRLTSGRWYTAAAVFDDRADDDPSNDRITLYLIEHDPGSAPLLRSDTMSRPLPGTAGPNLQIGGENLGVGAANYRKAFRGAVDYIAFWDYPLTEAHIRRLLDETSDQP